MFFDETIDLYLPSSDKEFSAFSVTTSIAGCNEVAYSTRFKERLFLHAIVEFFCKR